MTSDEMTDQITGRQFLDADGVEDWRPVWGGGWTCAYFRTGSFKIGVTLVEKIGALAAAAGHDPDVDLRAEGVTVRLFSGAWGLLSRRDIELARQISVAAHELHVPADPSRVQHVQVSIDATLAAAVRPFWCAVLGYDEVGDEDVPHDQVQARIAAAVAAGGHVVSDANAPGWWTLADPESNEVDLAIWMTD